MYRRAIRLLMMGILVPALCSAGLVGKASAKDDTAAVIGGLIVGAAVGAAVSKKHKHPKTVYVPTYVPVPAGGYGPAWADSFSPRQGVTCYPYQRACYKGNGAFAPNVTWNVFGN